MTKQSPLCYTMSKQPIELSLVEFELLSYGIVALHNFELYGS